MIYLAILAGSIGVGSYLYYRRSGPLRADGEKPLTLFPDKLTMNVEGGSHVRSLTFYGVNASAKHVQIKCAIITSALTETSLPLEIETRPVVGDPVASASSKLVSASWAGAASSPIPPGARIVLIAKFNAPLGLTFEDFIDAWGQFMLDIEDESHRYELAFTEKHLAVFLSGARRLEAITKVAASHKSMS
ncbi:hypothetical protein Msil_3168 [Methylocella silvestris BL2]|uniref:Uncharacterized protein n=1 Tax=Methylocella silvestris (strain DSM 15510 / CIP 108128 / LMG 27833 / NCIMB 13906 / BL2) TaxID=395965 RepID=B8EME8_METSB|nr:hypothetical protein [Methylocella silvestris]ACK52076.1 hypothetical protein Msil_3168 [Methylocella silvestris BL2]